MEDLKNGLTGFGLFVAAIWLAWGLIYFFAWANNLLPWWPIWGIISLVPYGVLVLWGMIVLFINWGESWRGR